MSRRLLGSTVAMTLMALLAWTTGAGAATKVGTECTATGVDESNLAAVQAVAADSSPLPVAAPESGIVTRWIVEMSFGEPNAVAQQLKVLQRPGESFGEYRVLAESPYEVAVNGTNVFPTRIPVPAGVHFGIGGSPSAGILGCGGGAAGAAVGRLAVNPPVGTTQSFSLTIGVETPVAVEIEPDADGDGYGDETQDGCPGDGDEHGPCPEEEPEPVVIAPPPVLPAPLIDAFAIRGKRAVTVLVTANTAAQVRTQGLVGVPGSGKRRTRRVVRLSVHPQLVLPGQLARVRLSFNPLLLRVLRNRRPGQKLTARIPLTATNQVGTFTRTLTVKLPGQKKAKRRR